jgi:serine/threonine protein phosphatase PrpC
MAGARKLEVCGQKVAVRISAATDVGLVRSANEDSYFAQFPFFLVADGMGGHANGDRASQEIVRVFSSRRKGRGPVREDAVLETIADANTAVRSLSPSDARSYAVAGSTLAGFALVETEQGVPGWMVFNVGDSRVYSWRDGSLVRLTVDHSAVQELVERGEISALEAEYHPDRNVVTRAIGVDDAVQADVLLLPAGGRQVFLACSDGLTKEVSETRIAEILGQSEQTGSFAPLAKRLVAAALEAGGGDNVTVVVVETVWEHPEQGLPSELEDTVPGGRGRASRG